MLSISIKTQKSSWSSNTMLILGSSMNFHECVSNRERIREEKEKHNRIENGERKSSLHSTLFSVHISK